MYVRASTKFWVFFICAKSFSPVGIPVGKPNSMRFPLWDYTSGGPQDPSGDRWGKGSGAPPHLPCWARGQGRGMQPVVWSLGGAPEGCRRWCGPADGGVNFFLFFNIITTCCETVGDGVIPSPPPMRQQFPNRWWRPVWNRWWWWIVGWWDMNMEMLASTGKWSLRR
jgi:hypothetical protein